MNGFMNTDVKDAGDHYEMDIDLPGFNKAKGTGKE
jgi:HSP20 family molecular chaperone IbpA